MIGKIIYAILGIILVTVVVMAVTGVIDMSGLIEWVKDASITVYEFFKGLIMGASA